MKLLLVVSLFFFTIECFGFSSVTGNQPRRGYDIHSHITHAVIDQLDFSYISFRILLSGIVSVDYYKNLINDASMHCDRNRKKSHLQALVNCQNKYQLLFKESQQNFSKKKYLKALYKLGQALHIAQDLVSHSNLSLLDMTSQKNIISSFLEGTKMAKNKDFKLTYWDFRDLDNNDKNHSSPYTHKVYSLDHPTQNNWSQKKFKDASKLSQFDVAFRLARNITGKVLRLYFLKFDEKEIKILKQYNR